MSKYILMAAGLLLAACGGRYPIASTGAVSMTHRSVEPGTKTTSLGEVESKYCTGEDPLVGQGKEIGLMDEAIMRAQKQSGADFITGVTFFAETNCVVLTGEGRKIAGGAPAATETPDSETPPGS